MSDPVLIINLVVSACAILVIPILTKLLDSVDYCIKHTKKSKCCNCVDVEFRKGSKNNLNDPEITDYENPI